MKKTNLRKAIEELEDSISKLREQFKEPITEENIYKLVGWE